MGVNTPEDEYFFEKVEGSVIGFIDPDDYWDHLKPVKEPKE